jgi:hypothetical protein
MCLGWGCFGEKMRAAKIGSGAAQIPPLPGLDKALQLGEQFFPANAAASAAHRSDAGELGLGRCGVSMSE